jgi:uncharacterized protein (DUF362 family)/NAD-dependent dihydropyrimidine dehydrogenase PreA subunit
MFKVSLKKCTSYESFELDKVLHESIDLIGGIENFIPKNGTILIKPNFLRAATRESMVLTDPAIVRAVAQMCFQSGAGKVLVGDSPAASSLKPILQKCGYPDILANTGIEYVEFNEWVEKKGLEFPQLILAKAVFDADVVINIAKAKTHAHTGLTLAVKNLFGCIPGLRKSQWHVRAGKDPISFAKMLVDVALLVNPSLNILDAVWGMEGNGPGNGTPRQVNAILASDNPFALDIVMSRILSYPLDQLPVHIAAKDMGVEPSTIDEIEILGDPLGDFIVNDLKHAVQGELSMMPGFLVRFLRNHATPKPFMIAKNCKKCRKCVEICPVQCITLSDQDKSPVIDRSKCIHCFCCQEVCPYDAIIVRTNIVSRLMFR